MTKKLADQFIRARRRATPLIWVSTPDQMVTIQKFTEAANESTPETPIVQWDIVNGFAGRNNKGVTMIESPAPEPFDNQTIKESSVGNSVQAIKLCQQFPDDSLVFVLNAHRYFKSTNHDQATAFMQAVFNLRDMFKENGRTLVMTGPEADLPAELHGDVMLLDEQYPDQEQLAEIIRETCSDAGVSPPDDQVDSAVEAVLGLPPYQAEQIVSLALQKPESNDGVCFDYEMLWAGKIDQVQQTPGLTVYRGGEDFSQIAGVQNAKDYLRRIMTGRSRPNVIVWLDEIEKSGLNSTGDLSGVNQDQLGTVLNYMEDHRVFGVMFVGVAGCAKSALAKAAGNEFGTLVLRIDMGAMKNKLMGQSEQQLRQALKIATAIGNDNLLWIATSNHIESLDTALKSRFARTFFFDLPAVDEKEAIWDIWTKHYEIDVSEGLPDDGGWTGRNIRNCCEDAWRIDSSIHEAAEFIIPQAVVDADEIQAMRYAAHKRYLSANHPGKYEMPEVSAPNAREKVKVTD